MGLLDSILGAVTQQALGGQIGQQALIQAAMGLISNHQGGLTGLLQQLSGAGPGNQVKSWVSTGANQPIDATQLQSALGQGPLGQIAQSLGVGHEHAASGLAQILPELINQLTPQGNVPHGNLLEQGLQSFTSQLLK